MTLRTRKSPKVQQDGKTLVAAYHTASPPLIWKFDLERNHSFALALQGEDGDWELGVTSPKEDFHPVARFMSREDAEEAFDKTQRALLSKKFGKWKTISFMLGGALIFLILFVLIPMSMTVRRAEIKGVHASSKTLAQPQDTAPEPLQDGVPMSADQVLKPPQ